VFLAAEEARQYDGGFNGEFASGPLPLVIDQHLAMDASGDLQLMLDADVWDSRISFTPGIPVFLAGKLDLGFAAGVDINAQIGRTFDIFDWTGVTPTGLFTLSSPLAWDLSKLYTSGQVTLVPEPGILSSLLLGAIFPLMARRANQRRGHRDQ
jgi:hypothetical protein